MARILYPDNILDPRLKPEEDAALVKAMWDEPRLFMESFLVVNNKDKGKMKFKMRPDQLLAYEQIQRIRGKRPGYKPRPVRIIVLKARQVGISTLIEALLFTFCRLRRDTTALILAQQNRTASVIFEMFKLFNEQLPKELQPDTARNTVSLMRFKKMNSFIIPATAKTPDPARGFALNMLHASELAYYADAKTTMHGIMAGMSQSDESFVALESTARGTSNYYYDKWIETVYPKTDEQATWTPIFLPFWMHEEYEDPLEDQGDDVRYAYENLSPAEKSMVDRWADESGEEGTIPFRHWQRKFKWRRRQIREEFGGNELAMNAEFPYDAQVAFTSKGESAFDLNALNWYRQNTVNEAGGQKGHITRAVNGQPYFVAGPDGDGETPLTIYHHPVPNMHYCIGLDAAMGSRQEAQRFEREQETEGQGAGDYSAMEVVSNERVQCAEYRKKTIDPFDLAEIAIALGYYYNTAMVFPEVAAGGGNASGYAVQRRLKHAHYPNLGMWEKWDHRNPMAKTESIGWEANFKSVPALIGTMARVIRHGAGLLNPEEVGKFDDKYPRLQIYSEELLRELLNFRIQSSGATGASKGHHDDLVRAFGLALLGLDQLPPPRSVHIEEDNRRLMESLPYNFRGTPSQWEEAGDYPSWLLA